jgi:hypothetical protein
MAWDRSEEENHTGSTVMVIVPDPDILDRAAYCEKEAMPKLCQWRVAI